VLEELEREGYVVVEDALEGGALRRVRAAVDRVFRSESADGGALHLLGFVGRDASFVELVDHPAVLPLVSAALGWNIFVYHCHLDVHPPEDDSAPRWRWHQDGGRQNIELSSPRPRLSLKVAYFLTDVASEAHGAMRVVPGSHRRDRLSRAREPAGAKPLLVRAGSAVVFDRRLWHARGDNRSSATRQALFYGYTHRWIRPRDELGLDPALVAGLSPLRRQLLGAGSSAIGYWIPEGEDVPLRELASAWAGADARM
jgi:ectoine hydroxylase-related dioxygenase (phytanoyl-CoA dioxygenase family)